MKLKNYITSKLRQFKQWILSIVMYRFIFMVQIEIKTKQFLGCQKKYYWFNQTGKYNIFKNKFYTDNKIEGSHDVSGWNSIIDVRDSIVSYQ